MKTLIIGDRPSPKMKKGAKPFEGAACEKRLKEWLSFLELDENNSFIINSETIDDLKIIAEKYLFEGYTKIIVLGKQAEKNIENIPAIYFLLPHPSGKNFQINDKEFIQQKLTECKKWLQN